VRAPEREEAGFSLIEVLIALAIFAAAVIPMLYVASSGQRLARSQPEASDLHQRIRVAADKIQRDLTMAGAGPLLGLAGTDFGAYVPPIVPSRTGLRLADPEMSAASDRVSVIYVADDGQAVRLAASMASASAPLRLDVAASGCAGPGVCGFTDGTRALVLDARGIGWGYDTFTVSSVNPATGDVAHDAPNQTFSRSYEAGAWIVPIVQHVYYFDRAGRRLMLYDGHKSDMPLVDNVVDATFSYFVDGSPSSVVRPPDGESNCLFDAGAPPPPRLADLGSGLHLIPAAELSDGPACGVSPNRFDGDLLRIRLVRVKLRLQAAAEDVRGTGPSFSRAGRSTSGHSYVPDYEVTFDVAPRNAGVSVVIGRQP
jgi:prepilin-type N-terminal cleavage/methylation domain-containing protein